MNKIYTAIIAINALLISGATNETPIWVMLAMALTSLLSLIGLMRSKEWN